MLFMIATKRLFQFLFRHLNSGLAFDESRTASNGVPQIVVEGSDSVAPLQSGCSTDDSDPLRVLPNGFQQKDAGTILHFSFRRGFNWTNPSFGYVSAVPFS